MEIFFKQGSGFILLGFLCALASSEVVTAKEFNTTKDLHVKIWNNKIPINSNSLLFARVSTRNLQINCSIPIGYEKPINLGWRKGQNWLDGRSVRLFRSGINTITLRLTIDHITWDLNGSIYWCGPKDNMFTTNVKGSQVTIITGDLPGPPLDIQHNIVDLKLYKINIKWRAASNLGRLPTQYDVTYIPCINKTYCQGTPRYQFCTIPHVIGKVNYKCSKLREEMKSLENMRDLYRVTIETINPLGKCKSAEFEIDVDLGGANSALLPTPSPPLSFNVSSPNSNTIIVQWTPRELWIIVVPKYTILYHKDKDQINKTEVVPKHQTMLTLRNLQPFTKYYFYITVEFRKDSGSSGSGVSKPLGPRIIRTPEGKPDPGPEIVNSSSSTYPHNTTIRNVTIAWKVPRSSEWQGKPSHIQINLRKSNSQDFQEIINLSATPNPPSQAFFSGLDSTATYIVSTALCNSKRCGNSGIAKTIEPIQGPREAGKTDFTKNYKIYLLAGLLLLVFVVFLSGLVYILVIKSKSKSQGTRPSLPKRINLEEDIYTKRYEDVEQLSCSEVYDFPNS